MDWQTIAAMGATAAVVGGFFVWFLRKGIPAIRKFWRLIDRITGVPAEGERPAQPGLFDRMDHQDATLEAIRHEVEFNNGSSVKDAVTRIEKRLDDHLTQPTTTINVNPPGGTP